MAYGKTYQPICSPWVCFLALFVITSPLVLAQEKPYPKIEAGLKYVHERSGDEPLSIHILRTDQSNPDLSLTITLAEHHIFGLGKISVQIWNIPRTQDEPVAAINGDFF
jgi:hypothetical protein